MRQKRENKEYQTCKAISQYLRLKYPNVLFHWDLAGLNLSRAQAGLMKAIQGCKGWPDLMILHPTSKKVLFIEVKAEGVKLTNRNGTGYATPHLAEQAETIMKIRGVKHKAMFSIGLDQALIHITSFLDNYEPF